MPCSSVGFPHSRVLPGVCPRGLMAHCRLGECLCPLLWTHAGVCPAPRGLYPLVEHCLTVQRNGLRVEVVATSSLRSRVCAVRKPDSAVRPVLCVHVCRWQWIHAGPRLMCVFGLPIARYLLGKLSAEVEMLVNAEQSRAGCAQKSAPGGLVC